jgi:hypothetical protein
LRRVERNITSVKLIGLTRDVQSSTFFIETTSENLPEEPNEKEIDPSKSYRRLLCRYKNEPSRGDAGTQTGLIRYSGYVNPRLRNSVLSSLFFGRHQSTKLKHCS